MAEAVVRRAIEWAVTARSRLGEATVGDLAVVALVPDGALVAALDGVGHGHEAARAAQTAGRVVRRFAGESLIVLLERCHEALRPTRGAAMSLAFFSEADSRMTWLGVGNVEGRLLGGEALARRSKGSLRLFRGVPGHELPAMTTATLDVQRGDVLILATDGIEAGFADSLDLSGPAQEVAERVLAGHWKATDDALVLVVRYLGAEL